jgi:hypothetical protein
VGNRVQFFAVRGRLKIIGESYKFSVKVTEIIAKGIEAKDSKTRQKAFVALVKRIKESFFKKESKTGKKTFESEAEISEKNFIITSIRKV